MMTGRVKTGEPPAGKGPSARIPTLVVDDSAASLAALCTLLTDNQQIQIVGTAPDGRAAIEAAKLHEPIIVLMDVQMPLLDGISATALLKREFPGVQVILVSFDDSPELRTLGLQNGARAFVPKQRVSQELGSVLAAILADLAR